MHGFARRSLSPLKQEPHFPPARTAKHAVQEICTCREKIEIVLPHVLSRSAPDRGEKPLPSADHTSSSQYQRGRHSVTGHSVLYGPTSERVAFPSAKAGEEFRAMNRRAARTS